MMGTNVFKGQTHKVIASALLVVAVISLLNQAVPIETQAYQASNLQQKAVVGKAPFHGVSLGRIEDAFQWEMSKNGPQFSRMIELLNGKQGSAAVFFDVGTNVGVFPVKIGNACPSCIIHGFEPVRAYFEFARAKAADNPNVKITNAAASDVDGMSTIMVSDGGGNEKKRKPRLEFTCERENIWATRGNARRSYSHPDIRRIYIKALHCLY